MIGNPVLRKELLVRSRFRHSTPARIGLGIAVVSVLGVLYYQVFTLLLYDQTPSAAHSAWIRVMTLQFACICLFAPALAANAIAQEREQQTWDLLMATRLRPDEIVLGKLLARIILVVAFMALILPVSVYCMVEANVFAQHALSLDGSDLDTTIALSTFLSAEATTLIAGVFFITFSLFMSWLLNRTLYALILSYTFVVGGLILCTTLIASMLQSIVSDGNFLSSCPLMWFNPVMMFGNAVYPNNIARASLYLSFGLTGYCILTALMVWRMIDGFQRFSND